MVDLPAETKRELLRGYRRGESSTFLRNFYRYSYFLSELCVEIVEVCDTDEAELARYDVFDWL